MTKKLITIFILISYSFVHSQISFQKGYNSVAEFQNMGTNGANILQTTDSGFVFIGINRDNLNAGSDDVYLIKTNRFGDTIWTKIYGTAMHDAAYRVIQTSDGGFAFAGYWNSGITYYCTLIKTNSIGDTLWTKKYVSSNQTFAHIVQQTSDGGFIIAGSAVIGSNEDFLLIKTDALGNFQWSQRYGGTGMDRAFSVFEIIGSGYIISGLSGSFGNGGQIYFVRTNLLGNLVWSKTYGGSGADVPWSMQKTNDNGYIALAKSTSFNGSNQDFYIVKTDSAGAFLWSKVYDVGLYDTPYYIASTSDNGNMITGTTSGGAFALKINSIGDTVWAKNIDVSTSGALCSTKTFDNGYAFLTSRYSTSSNGLSIIKTDSLATSCTQVFVPVNIISHTTFTSIAATVSNSMSFSVSSLALLIGSRGSVTNICNVIGIKELNNSNNIPNIYPNPNKGSFKIQLDNEISNGQIILINTLGQKVYEQKISQGENNIVTLDLTSGLYTYIILQDKRQISNGKLAVE